MVRTGGGWKRVAKSNNAAPSRSRMHVSSVYLARCVRIYTHAAQASYAQAMNPWCIRRQRVETDETQRRYTTRTKHTEQRWRRLDHPADDDERLKEALVRKLVCSINGHRPRREWLNPTEDLPCAHDDDEMLLRGLRGAGLLPADEERQETARDAREEQEGREREAVLSTVLNAITDAITETDIVAKVLANVQLSCKQHMDSK